MNSKYTGAQVEAILDSVANKADKSSVPTVTDTYSATSSNAMSGKAVASAISSTLESLNANNISY